MRVTVGRRRTILIEAMPGFDSAFASAIRAGCTSIYLQVSHGNNSARTFYGRRGYTERSDYKIPWKPVSHGGQYSLAGVDAP